MTVSELIEKLRELPGDLRVEVLADSQDDDGQPCSFYFAAESVEVCGGAVHIDG